MAGAAAVEFRSALAQPLSWFESVVAVVHAITSFCSIMLRNIPPVWLYGGIVLFGSMYAVLFGVGDAVLKAVRAHHEPSPV